MAAKTGGFAGRGGLPRRGLTQINATRQGIVSHGVVLIEGQIGR
jgi:hypothetical protein